MGYNYDYYYYLSSILTKGKCRLQWFRAFHGVQDERVQGGLGGRV